MKKDLFLNALCNANKNRYVLTQIYNFLIQNKFGEYFKFIGIQ